MFFIDNLKAKIEQSFVIMTNHLSIKQKQAIIKLHLKGFKNALIAKKFEIHRNIF